VDLNKIAPQLRKKENGIYFSEISSAISYPEEGNELFMQIEEDSFWFRHRNDVIAAVVKQYMPRGPFFDIGGGNGFVSKRLQDEGFDVALVEPGITGARNARARGLEYVICSTLEDAGFKPSSLASVGLFDVVEHIKHDDAFLGKIRALMTDEACVFLTVPAYNVLWSDEDRVAGHFRRYSLPDLQRLLRRSGFVIEYATYIFSMLPLPIFLFRSIPSRLGIYKNPGNYSTHNKAHDSGKGIFNQWLNKVWDLELKTIRRSGKVPFGGSCFAVARKPSR
jgi:hypothetical protein